ncbi:hypothetical protein BJ322DRAFT_1111282 [Thelephora terrestris]|uniref:Fe2OG dioxygenase domain-containing protein n=1 Tax=Thelephora terrestris TaxID=56493 RepID=A0A9P6H9H0_9AGAM|nr:hypothetical protein BJ322DRAFT_1111282 [Thelephora terrestris]
MPPATTVADTNNLGEGDSYLVLDLLSDDEDWMEKLKQEVEFKVMLHRGGEVPRLVAVQGEINEDGSFPIYRHPADASPPLLQFSPTVSRIRVAVEAHLNHPVNHVLIQHYRSGKDYISEHSDKTIDVVAGSKIVNVSIGATRSMTLKTKKDAQPSAGETEEDRSRKHQKFSLPDRSMFVMGLGTNAKWLHSVRHDNRPVHTKSEEERYMNGERISLTFRNIGTFLNAAGTKIWGQGAVSKSAAEAQSVVTDQEEVEKLIDWFGRENHQSNFDWHGVYGQGSDVVNFTQL